MSYQTERDAFMATMSKAGVPLDVARAVLRNASTIERLAVAACNGDWPCDNCVRAVKFCSICESGVVPSQLSKAGVCPSCRAEARIRAALAPFGVSAVFGGDPRGYTVKLLLPTGAWNTMGGQADGFGVPVRS